MRLPALAVAVLMLAGCGAGEPVAAETVTQTETATVTAAPEDLVSIDCKYAVMAADDVIIALMEAILISADLLEAGAAMLDAAADRDMGALASAGERFGEAGDEVTARHDVVAEPLETYHARHDRCFEGSR